MAARDERTSMHTLSTSTGDWGGGTNEVHVLSGRHQWQYGAEIVRGYLQYVADDEPVVLVGYSWGGNNVLRLAGALQRDGICVDFLAAIDAYAPWGRSRTVPTNVAKAAYYHTDGDAKGLDGWEDLANLQFGERRSISGYTHETIDDLEFVRGDIRDDVKTIRKKCSAGSNYR